jgi:hypothetical protein
MGNPRGPPMGNPRGPPMEKGPPSREAPTVERPYLWNWALSVEPSRAEVDDSPRVTVSST